jgi:hypothetical protein
MVIKRTLNRLLRLRELEEELSRLQLEIAVAERSRRKQEVALAASSQAQGRRSFAAGIGEQNQLIRTAGLLESEEARKRLLRLQPYLETADLEVTRQQAEFLSCRTGRRQVETLLENEMTQAEVETGRRAQQMLDDWYGRRIVKKTGGRS